MEMRNMDKSDSFRDEVSELHDSHKRYDNTQDRIDMDRLGKKQELKRNFRLLSIFSFMCVAMSCWVFVIRYALE
jgi:choline transport protein